MLKNKKLRGLIQVFLSLLLLSLLLYQVGFDEVVQTFANIQWGWYALAFGLFLLNVVIRAYRWFILLHSLDARPPFSRLLYLYFLGFFANNFIPSGFGGDVVKVVNLRQRYGHGAEALSSVVMDRATGLVGSSMIALVALAWYALSNQSEKIALPTTLWAVIALISVGIPLGFMIIRWSDTTGFFSKHLPAVTRLSFYAKLERLIDTVRRYPFPVLMRSLLISLPFTISLIFIQYFIARALNADVPLSVFPLFVPLIALLNLLPIAFNGLGVREGVYLFLFVPVGVLPETAVAMSLAFYFLRVTTGLIGGLLYALNSLLIFMRISRAAKL